MIRSVLQEGPSVPKAIEKAWFDAGRPSEFTIKVFDVGEKNFLGFSRRPAVVSIMFDPKKVASAVTTPSPAVDAHAPAHSPRRDYSTRNHGPILPGYAKRQRVEKHDRADHFERPEHSERTEHERERKHEEQRPNHQAQPRYQQQHPQQRPHNQHNNQQRFEYENRQQQAQHHKPEVRELHDDVDSKEDSYADNYLWTTEAIEDIKEWLGKLTTIMKIGVAFSLQAENHLLRIDFEKPVFDSPGEERMLFSSFAYILMQFLKRKHKKKFRGCRLAISSKR